MRRGNIGFLIYIKFRLRPVVAQFRFFVGGAFQSPAVAKRLAVLVQVRSILPKGFKQRCGRCIQRYGRIVQLNANERLHRSLCGSDFVREQRIIVGNRNP